MSEAMGLRERVAMTMCAKLFASHFGVQWRPSPEMLEVADAAIAEVFAWLEEPTEEMVTAGGDVESEGACIGFQSASECWRAMLRAAREAASRKD